MSNLDIQQGDVLLYQSTDGGEINVAGGIVEMNSGLETAAYLSLFGGNQDDSGRADDPRTWWGNLGEIDPARQYISETQNIVSSLPLTSENVRRIEEAVKRDLAWFVTSGAASEINATVTVPALDTIRVCVNIDANGLPVEFVFFANWQFEVNNVPLPANFGVGSAGAQQGYISLEDDFLLLQENGFFIELEN